MAQFPPRYLPETLTDEDRILAESVLMLIRTGEVQPYKAYMYYGYSSDVVCRWHVTKFLSPEQTSPYCWLDIVIADCVGLWKSGRKCCIHDLLLCGDCPFWERDKFRTNVGNHVMLRFGTCSQSGVRTERCSRCRYYADVYPDDGEGEQVAYNGARWVTVGQDDEKESGESI